MVAENSPPGTNRVGVHMPSPAGIACREFGGPDADQVLVAVAAVSKQRQDAVANCTRAVRLDPRNADAWRRLGISLVGCGRIEDALAAFEASLECDSTAEDTFVLIADTKVRLRRFADALAYVRAMPYLARHRFECRVIGAVCLVALGKLAHARAVVVRALCDFPDNAALLTLLGGMDLTVGDIEAAKGRFEQVLKDTPDSYDASFGLAETLDIGGDRAGACRLFECAFAIDPVRFEAPFSLAAAAFLASDYEALDHWTEIGLRAAPLHPRLLYLRAWVEASAGNRRTAEIMLRAAVARDPNHQATHFAIARLLLWRHKYMASAFHLDATVQLNASNNQGRAAVQMLHRLQQYLP